MICNEPLIRSAFECVRYEVAWLGRRWRANAPIYTIRSIVRAADDFVVAMLENGRLARFEELSEGERDLAHDAYVRVLVLADLFDEARDTQWADVSDIGCAHDCVTDLLDALEPCVSLADRALRRVTLEGIEVTDACQWIDEQIAQEVTATSTG
ncbi:MAG TPA: hypothetical protein VGG28_23905 [Kofleriaceae bacterium]